MDNLPFSVYDFFACLSSGLVALVGLGAAFAGSDHWQATPPPVVALVLVVVIYGIGHVMANLSGHFYEGIIVRRWLNMPSTNLMAADQPTGVWPRVFPGYFRRLPGGVRTRVAERAAVSGIGEGGEELFLAAFAVAKRDNAVYARLATFLNLYGFCRNVSLAAFLSGLCLITGVALGTAHTGTIVSPAWCAAGSFALGVGLFYRYLKFYRQYAREVLLNYGNAER